MKAQLSLTSWCWRILTILVGVVALSGPALLGLVLLSFPSSLPPPRLLSHYTSPPPLLVAHRGYSSVAPENTLASLQAAASRGISIVEVDVMLSVDSVVVCAHDYSLESFTNGSGMIDDLTWAQLESIEVTRGATKSPEAPEGVGRLARLDSFLLAAKELNIALFIEIKVPRKSSQLKALLYGVSDAIEGSGQSGKVLILSFFPHLLRGIKAINPNLYTMFLYTPDGLQRWCALGVSLEGPIWSGLCWRPKTLDALTPFLVGPIAKYFGADSLGVAVAGVTEENMALFRSHGFQFIAAWTTNTLEQKQQVKALGVDCVISDCPEESEVCPSDVTPL